MRLLCAAVMTTALLIAALALSVTTAAGVHAQSCPPGKPITCRPIDSKGGVRCHCGY